MFLIEVAAALLASLGFVIPERAPVGLVKGLFPVHQVAGELVGFFFVLDEERDSVVRWVEGTFAGSA